MKTIVIATDGSPAAREAVRYGIDLAQEQQTRLAFVQVVPAPNGIPVGLVEAAELAASRGIDTSFDVLDGSPVDEIVTYADSLDADMLVVGSRGRRPLAGALLGSTSSGVLHESRRPVLVIRSKET
jgi:nucleotide-binding universal stress UspA family protein